jgi:hypothetical protein
MDKGYQREYYKKNKDKIKEYQRKYCKKNKDKIKKQKKEYFEINKEYKKEYDKKYYQKPEVKKRIKEYLKNNKEHRKEQNKEYHSKLKNKIRRNKKNIERRKLNTKYLTMGRLRSRLRHAFLKYSKEGKVNSSQKYNINYQKIFKYLKPFPKDIKNYEIDHIIPLSWFDFNNPNEITWAFAPENHQWLTKEENLKKGNRYILVADRTIKNDILKIPLQFINDNHIKIILK